MSVVKRRRLHCRESRRSNDSEQAGHERIRMMRWAVTGWRCAVNFGSRVNVPKIAESSPGSLAGAMSVDEA